MPVLRKHERLDRFLSLLIRFASAESTSLVEAIDEARGPSFYASLLQQCRSLFKGRQIHAHLRRYELDRETFIGNHLVQMYGNCGSVEDARSVFDNLWKGNVFSWNMMVAAYAQNGHLQDACSLFERMPIKNVVSWNGMIVVYARNGLFQDARELFDTMPERNVVSWNTMATLYAENGQLENGKSMFERMPERDGVSWNAILQMYAQIGHLEDAKEMFEKMPQRDVVSWTALIQANVQHGYLQVARNMFDSIPKYDMFVCNTMITAYAQNGHPVEARRMFDATPQRNTVSWNGLLQAHAQSGHIEDAKNVFDAMPHRDMISWNTMLAAYAQNGNLENANILFQQMSQRSGISWTLVMTGFAHFGNIEVARAMFDKMPSLDVVSWTAMIQAYAENGHLDYAETMFDSMPCRDMVSWTAMIKGYAQYGQGKLARHLFHRMDLEGFKPNIFIYVSVLDACATTSALDQGKLIHAEIMHASFYPEEPIGNALLSMYGRCGRLDYARNVFDKMPQRGIISWNAMVAAYAQNGYAKEALELFQLMKHEGVEPNDVTYISILSVCSHAGLLTDGLYHLRSINSDYTNVVVNLDHYMCMIDLLGRAGQLQQAHELVQTMPFEPDVTAWKTLLSACTSHGDMDRGQDAATRAFQLNAEYVGPYILLSNIHAAAAIKHSFRPQDELPRNTAANARSIFLGRNRH